MVGKSHRRDVVPRGAQKKRNCSPNSPRADKNNRRMGLGSAQRSLQSTPGTGRIRQHKPPLAAPWWTFSRHKVGSPKCGIHPHDPAADAHRQIRLVSAVACDSLRPVAVGGDDPHIRPGLGSRKAARVTNSREVSKLIAVGNEAVVAGTSGNDAMPPQYGARELYPGTSVVTRLVARLALTIEPRGSLWSLNVLS